MAFLSKYAKIYGNNWTFYCLNSIIILDLFAFVSENKRKGTGLHGEAYGKGKQRKRNNDVLLYP